MRKRLTSLGDNDYGCSLNVGLKGENIEYRLKLAESAKNLNDSLDICRQQYAKAPIHRAKMLRYSSPEMP
jgi:hypothetical protein